MTTTTINKAIEALKNEYKKENEGEKNDNFLNWLIKGISGAVLFENGFVYEFEKKSIKKHFCFGAGMYASCTDEEQKDASDAVTRAENDKNYFIEENFKENFEFIEKLLGGDGQDWAIYAAPAHSFKPSNRCYLISEKTILYRDEDLAKYYKLTDADIKNLKSVLAEEKEKLTKRLNTYLKKYGLSKIEVWSYIRD